MKAISFIGITIPLLLASGCASNTEPVNLVGIFDHKTRSITECSTGKRIPVIFRSVSYLDLTNKAAAAGTSYESQPLIDVMAKHLGAFTGNTARQAAPKHMDEAFYRGLASELSTKVGRISSFVSHGPSIGTYHEEVLRSVLRHMLPNRFSLRTGFVFHPERGPSHQGDILIVDEHYPGAYFFREGEFAVVAEEALVCVIEVKTRLNKTTFGQLVRGLYSFQKVTAKPNHPVTLLYAYESSSFSPSILDGWYKSVDLPDEVLSYPFAIYALNSLLKFDLPAGFDVDGNL